jgi:hypothetical protein
VEKEIMVNENNEIIPEYDKIPSTITLSSGHVLEEVEFVDGKLEPVVKRVKRKGIRTTKKALFEKLYAENLGLKNSEKRLKEKTNDKGICNQEQRNDSRYSPRPLRDTRALIYGA